MNVHTAALPHPLLHSTPPTSCFDHNSGVFKKTLQMILFLPINNINPPLLLTKVKFYFHYETDKVSSLDAYCTVCIPYHNLYIDFN